MKDGYRGEVIFLKGLFWFIVLICYIINMLYNEIKCFNLRGKKLIVF